MPEPRPRCPVCHRPLGVYRDGRFYPHRRVVSVDPRCTVALLCCQREARVSAREHLTAVVAEDPTSPAT
jgi:hypothetical protein